MRRFLIKSALAIGIVTLACSGSDIAGPGTDTTSTSNTPASVAIAPPASTDMVVGATINLVGSVKNATGQDLNGIVITWASSAPTVATVSQTGALTALKVGSTIIIGSASGRSASITINVKAVPVSQVVVTVRTTLVVGETATAAAIATDASGNALTGRVTTWTSRNAGVATVASTGVVTAVSSGNATIDALIDGVLGSATVVVSPAIIPVGIVSLSTNLLALTPGNTAQVTAIVRDNLGNVVTDRVTTWVSSNTDVATVSQTGIVTAIALGSAQITATSEGRTAAVTVNVTGAPVVSVSITGNAGALQPGQTSQLAATLRDANNVTLAGRVLTWASSAPTVVTVSQTGVVTAVSVGTTNITGTSEGITGTLAITVTAATGGATTAPSVSTLPVAFLGSFRGIRTFGLNGDVNPNGLATRAWLEWSRDPSMTTGVDTVGAVDIGSGVAPVRVTGNLPISFTDTSTYFYRVGATNSKGLVRGVTKMFAAVKPSGVATNTRSQLLPRQQVRITWDYTETDPRIAEWAAGTVRVTLGATTFTAPPGQRSATDSIYSLAATTLTYTLEACNVFGCGPATTLTVTGVGVPAPSNFQIAGNALGEPVLTWADNSTDEEFFSIQRQETLTSTITYFQAPANGTTFTDTTAQPTKAYQYLVRAAIGNRISASTPIITYTRP